MPYSGYITAKGYDAAQRWVEDFDVVSSPVGLRAHFISPEHPGGTLCGVPVANLSSTVLTTAKGCDACREEARDRGVRFLDRGDRRLGHL